MSWSHPIKPRHGIGRAVRHRIASGYLRNIKQPKTLFSESLIIYHTLLPQQEQDETDPTDPTTKEKCQRQIPI